MPEQRDSTTPYTHKSRRPGQSMTKEQRTQAQEKFLKSFSFTANVRAACKEAGIDRTTVYRWRDTDEQFKEKFDLASEDANDMIRAAMFQRGVQGYEKPLTGFGKAVIGPDGKPMTERVYSDMLLALLAKARMPEFREPKQTKQEETQPLEPQHGLFIANYEYATQEELDSIQHIQDAINKRKEEAEQGKIVQMRRTG